MQLSRRLGHLLLLGCATGLAYAGVWLDSRQVGLCVAQLRTLHYKPSPWSDTGLVVETLKVGAGVPQ